MPENQRHEFDSRQGRAQFSPEPLPALAPAVKRYILGLYYGIAAVAIVVMWGVFLFDFPGGSPYDTPGDIASRHHISIWICSIFTVGICLVTPYLVHRRLCLATHGVEILGIVTGFGRAPSLHEHSLARVDYTYEVGGKIYEKANSTSDTYSPGDPIRLVIDLRRPGNCQLRSRLFPPDAQDKATRKAERIRTSKWWWCWVLLGSAFLGASMVCFVAPESWKPGPPRDGNWGIFDLILAVGGLPGMGVILAVLGIGVIGAGLHDRKLGRQHGKENN